MKAFICLILFLIFFVLSFDTKAFCSSELTDPKGYQNDITFSIVISRIRDIQGRLSTPTISAGERESLERELTILKKWLTENLQRSIHKSD